MLRTSYYNKNILLSMILILVFIVSIGAMLPVVTNSSTNNKTNGSFVNSATSTGQANQPSTGLQPINPVRTNLGPTAGRSSTSVNYQPAKTASVASTASTTAVTIPAYNTTTVYANGTNFNVATPNLLPFAEKYRINSTLNGWVYPNGLSPDYVPLNPLFYSHSNLAAGASINSTSATDFPVSALRFIPGFPVTIVLKSNNTQVGIAVYNTSNYIVASSTNTAYVKSVTFTPTSEQIYSALVTELTTINPASFNLTIQQYVTPKFFNLFVGDQGSATGTFNWFFNSSITSFGLLTPPTLDLDTLTYNRSDTATIDYTYKAFTGYGYNTVIDNASYWSTNVRSFFYINSTSACNDAQSLQTRCQSFLPMFFYDSASSYPLNTGLWVPSLETNHVFGANPQVLNLMGYFGQTGIQGITNVLVLNSKGKTVLDLSNQFTKANATSFVETLSILLPTTTLINGSYTLKVYNGALELYSYPFKVLDSLYGNYNAPVVNFGYETTRFLSNYNTETNGTIVYADVKDKDTSVAKVMLSYNDGSSWSTPSSMTWLDVNKYGFVIPLNLSNVVNVSISVFESAPSDQGNMRLQVQSQFLPDVIDLSVNTSTTMEVTFIPRGGSTTSNTLLKFLNDGSYQLSGLSGAQVTSSGGYYVYDITSTVAQNTKYVVNFNITPKNNGILTVNTTAVAESGTLQESQNVYLNILGLTTPTLELSFVTQSNGKLANLYPYLNSTYPVTVKYRFIGGTPSADYNLAVNGSGGSLTTSNLPITTQGKYPLVYYQTTVNVPVVKTFAGSSTTITANMTFGTSKNLFTATALSYKPVIGAVLNDINGLYITRIYHSLLNQLNMSLELQFNNGTPETSLSFTVSSTQGLFTSYSSSIDVSKFTGPNYNVSFGLERNSFTKASDDLKIDITWDGNSVSKIQHVVVYSYTKYSDVLNTQITSTGSLDIQGSSYTITGKISSTFTIPLRNLTLNLTQSYGLTISPKLLHIPVLEPGKSVTFSFTLNYSNTSDINYNTLNFGLTMNVPTYSQYSYNFVVNTNSQVQTNSQNTSSSSTSSTTRTTPGFSLYLLILAPLSIVLLRKIRKNN